MQLRIANQQAMVSRYNLNICGVMAMFAEFLLLHSCAEFSALVEERKLISRTSLQAAYAASRIVATGVAVRSCSWLQVWPPL